MMREECSLASGVWRTIPFNARLVHLNKQIKGSERGRKGPRQEETPGSVEALVLPDLQHGRSS